MRTEAAKIGDVTLQIVRDWAVKFNAHGPDGLIDRKAPGQPPKLNDAHRAALMKMIEEGPTPAVHGVVRWRLIDLAQWMFEEFRLSIAVQTLSRELRKMGYRKLSARPRHHAQAEGAIEDFKKHFRPPGGNCARKRRRHRQDRGLVRRRSAHRSKEQNHPSMGEARIEAERAERSAHRLDLYLRRRLPKQGKGAALVLPACNTFAMNSILAEIGKNVAPNAHAALVVDRAGWHMTEKLVVPANITIVPLPAKCPELNPAENVWQFPARQLAVELRL